MYLCTRPTSVLGLPLYIKNMCSSNSYQHYGALRSQPTIAVLGFVFTAVSLRRWRSSPHLPYPPGPKISWFGAGSLPKVAPWLTYCQPMLILNSARVTRDLLETQGSIFSSRAHFVMETEMMGWERGITGMPYEKRLQEHRTMLNKYMSPENAMQHHSLETLEARKLVRDLSKKTYFDNVGAKVHRIVTSVMMQIAYGHEILDETDRFATLAAKAVERVGAITLHGLYLVNFIPILKYIPSWLPGAQFKRDAKVWNREVKAMIDEPFERVKKLNEGSALSCVVTQELERPPSQDLEDKLSEPHEAMVKNVAGICYSGKFTFKLFATLEGWQAHL
ncbi:hypothetical protein GYMLUDRAFT_63070 [Collybiopsis luxurians FD-317 M1]|uniref:Cytochrome P450 n=1 Tax=Collybiopsis luxurians FD-317 M1 TaxID=944289 RepID=A0A0D0C9M7_9AGAR|nr:hypothetical protein GYMLUDRAFT_63070 [Collybiopsis luxurians FD-317 M1]